ncbi:hypothetical protein Tco_0968390 [Tanacetum coccineum]
METNIELTLEQTQQGVSDEVLVSIEGVEELKRKVKIKGEKKEALLTLRQEPGTMEILPEPTSNKLCDKEKYEHVGPKVTSSQEGKRSQDDDKRLDLTNDLKEAQVHIQVKLKEQAQA